MPNEGLWPFIDRRFARLPVGQVAPKALPDIALPPFTQDRTIQPRPAVINEHYLLYTGGMLWVCKRTLRRYRH
jgi:hypothetical protein